MLDNQQKTSGTEKFFKPDEIIVSKTDLKGKVTYANSTFLEIAGYKESEVLGKPHSLIRHEDMPRAVFKLLWQTLEKGEEIFAFVKNKTKSNDFYWVFAHVTPTFDSNGTITGYHSNRRVPSRKALEKVIPFYQKLVEIEHSKSSRKEGLALSYQALEDALSEVGLPYDEFVFSLQMSGD